MSLCPKGTLSRGLCPEGGGSLSRGRGSLSREEGLCPGEEGLCPGEGISVQGVSVQGVSVQGVLCPGGSPTKGSLCLGWGVSVLRGLCPGGPCLIGSLSRWSLSLGVSVQGDLCPGVSVQGRRVSIQGKGICSGEFSVQGGLHPRGVSVWGVGSLSKGSLFRGVSVQGSPCLRWSLSLGVSVKGGLCTGEGVSVQGRGLCPGEGVSVQGRGSLSRGGGLCPGGSLSRGVSDWGRGLCPGVSFQRVSVQGVSLTEYPHGMDTPEQRPRTPYPCAQTDTCENITFANFVCGR